MPTQGGFNMNEEYKKQRYTVWLTKEAVDKSDTAVTIKNFANRSDFIEKAIHFYCGYIYQEEHSEFLSDTVTDSMEGIAKALENRFGKLLFKIAVEMAKLEQMLASINEMDDETIERLHKRCVDEVKKINGIIKMEDAVKYQRRDDK